MAFITYPLNNIDYTAEDAELFHCTRTSGIWAEDSFSIFVTGADNNVTIGTGIAWINNKEFSGKIAALKSAEVLDLGIADGTYPRIDVIAIQYSANNNATDVVIKKGTPSTNPARPAIVRSGAVYELYLASVYRPAGATAITASNITDLRMDKTVCGLMADSVTSIDTSAINTQVKALIASLEAEIQGVKDTSGLMFESEWVNNGTIPVSKGGTGATTAANARSNLGLSGAEIKTLLWTNASASSSFAEQTLTVTDLSEYDGVFIIFNRHSTVIMFNDTDVIDNSGYIALDRSLNRYINGRATIVTPSRNAIKIGNNTETTLKPNTVSNATKNTNCIPLEIYGIKGVQ